MKHICLSRSSAAGGPLWGSHTNAANPPLFDALNAASQNLSSRSTGVSTKLKFSLRHSPWQHVPSSQDCWRFALISQRAARHCDNAGVHGSVPNNLLPTPRPKIHDWKSAFRRCRPSSPLLGLKEKGVRFSSIHEHQEEKGLSGRTWCPYHTPADPQKLFSLEENLSAGSFHPCHSLTMLSSLAILFLFVILNYIGEKSIVSVVLK